MNRLLARRSRMRLAAVLGAVALSVSGCGFSGLYNTDLPGGADLGDHPFHVTVYFQNVLDLVPQSSVKVNDVTVGKVESVALTTSKDDLGVPGENGWSAKVKIAVNDSVHLPANARAAVSQTSLLGEKYVDLEQPLGAATGTLGNGSVIKLSSTTTAPEVEQVLGALSALLNGGGLQQVKTITTELNKALNGRTGEVRDLVTQLDRFVQTLNGRKNDILDALSKINQLSITLNQQRQTIVDALDILPRGLRVLNQEKNQLVTLLSSLSDLGTTATGVINATQPLLVSSLKKLGPVLNRLAASGADLPQSLKILGTFPFPIGSSSQIVHGDYANLALVLNLNLSDELCGLSKQLCNLIPKAASASGQQLSSAGATSTGAIAPNSTGQAYLPGVSGS